MHIDILRTLARLRHYASSAPQVGDSGDPGHEEARQPSATPNETSALCANLLWEVQGATYSISRIY